MFFENKVKEDLIIDSGAKKESNKAMTIKCWNIQYQMCTFIARILHLRMNTLKCLHPH